MVVFSNTVMAFIAGPARSVDDFASKRITGTDCSLNISNACPNADLLLLMLRSWSPNRAMLRPCSNKEMTSLREETRYARINNRVR